MISFSWCSGSEVQVHGLLWPSFSASSKRSVNFKIMNECAASQATSRAKDAAKDSRTPLLDFLDKPYTFAATGIGPKDVQHTVSTDRPPEPLEESKLQEARRKITPDKTSSFLTRLYDYVLCANCNQSLSLCYPYSILQHARRAVRSVVTVCCLAI